MSAAKLDEIKLNLVELNKLLGLAERQRVKNLLQVEIRKAETESLLLQDACKMEIDSVSSEPKKIVTPAPNKCYEVKLTNYAWDQSDKFVKLFITLKNVQTIPEENVHCDFDTRSIELYVKALENRNYSFTVKNLLENIDVVGSKWKVKKDMVVVFLSKTKNNNWSYLTTVEKQAKEPKTEMPKLDANEDPNASLMQMMKKMYDEGDDEMKRTIAKSWTENSQRSNMADL